MNQLSTANILDESVRGDSLPDEGKSSPAVTRDCPNRGRDLSAISSAAILDVADQGKANSLRIGSLCVGDEGVGTASHKCSGEIVHGLSGRATDSQVSTPLYLLASEIVDVVTKGYEQ